MHLRVHMCALRGPRGGDTIIVMSILNNQILVSNYHSPLKGTWAPWRNG